LPGFNTKIAHLDSSITSIQVELSSEVLEELASAFPFNQVAGNQTLHMGPSTPPKTNKNHLKLIRTLNLLQQDLDPFQPYSDSRVVNLEITIHKFWN
jgi:hypothetical protein